MKKTTLGLIMLLSFNAMFAQMTNNSNDKSKKATTTTKPTVTTPIKPTVPTSTNKPVATTPVKPAVTTTNIAKPVVITPAKKDEMPDKGIKENKRSNTIEQKKNGTTGTSHRRNKLKNKKD